MIKKKCPFCEKEVEVAVLPEYLSYRNTWTYVYLCRECKRLFRSEWG